MPKPRQGKIAVVAGATRGAGRGIACTLGEAGATVYCTGRSTREKLAARKNEKGAPFDLAKRPETIEEMAEMVTARGGVAALAADLNIAKKSGRVFSSWDLAEEYGFTDIDGQKPHWARHFEKTYGRRIKKCAETFYAYWFNDPMAAVFPDWP